MRISFNDYTVSFRQLRDGERICGERMPTVERARDLLPDINLTRSRKR